jgi:predicted phosphodiesterase
MLHDFIPIIQNLPIAEHPNGITIIPLADAHFGSQEFNEVRWHQTIKRIYEDPHCFCVIAGDLLDTGTRSSVTSPYSQTCSPRRQKEWLIDELRCISSKILACTDGNHEKRVSIESDQYPLYDVMLALGREDVYRENICFVHIRLFFDWNGKKKHRISFTAAVTHGAGGGQYIGSSANRVQTFGQNIEGIDLLITGHTHRPLTFPVSRLVFDPDAKTIKQKQFTVAVASSFLDYGGYPVQKLLPPTAHTTTEIKLNYTQDGKKEVRVLQ